jgi:hypothetical protein
VEEHWHREGATRSAARVRSRIEGAVAGCDKASLAREIYGGNRPRSEAISTRNGLDDGVNIV